MSASRMPLFAPRRSRARAEIDCGGGFSDAALAGGDGNDVLRARNASCLGRAEFEFEDGVFAEPVGDSARVVSFDTAHRVAEMHLRVPLAVQVRHAPHRAQLTPGRGENRIPECLQGLPFRRHLPRPAPCRLR